MAHVEDRWEKVVAGRRQRTDRPLRQREALEGVLRRRRRPQTFARKGDAERFLVAVEADLLRGTYVDPQRKPRPAAVTAGASRGP